MVKIVMIVAFYSIFITIAFAKPKLCMEMMLAATNPSTLDPMKRPLSNTKPKIGN
jgi:hypothetical protein